MDALFKIGDHIVYPMQGVGTIEAIEEKEIQGEVKQYFMIKIPSGNMQLMVPMEKIESSSIRLVMDNSSLAPVLNVLKEGVSDDSLSWKQRYKINSDKMKTGLMQEGAEVIRDLMRIKKDKKLNSNEKFMLDNAKEILVGELGLIKGFTKLQAIDYLNSRLDDGFSY